MSEVKPERPAPQPSIELTIGNDKRKLTMSFGLLNEVASAVGSIDNIDLIMINPNMQRSILVTLLSERDAEGTITKPANLHTMEIDIQTVGLLISWVTDHLIDFFIGAMSHAKMITEKYQPVMQELMSSLDGSKA